VGSADGPRVAAATEHQNGEDPGMYGAIAIYPDSFHDFVWDEG